MKKLIGYTNGRAVYYINETLRVLNSTVLITGVTPGTAIEIAKRNLLNFKEGETWHLMHNEKQ